MQKLLNSKAKSLFFILMAFFLIISPVGNLAHAASEKLYVGALAVSEVENDTIKLHAQTNLPKKMKFFVKITGSDDFEKKVKLKVKKDGKLKKKVNDLPNGTYTVLYQSYQPKKQSGKMKKIIGEKGDNLKGDLVNKKKVVKFTETIKVTNSSVKSKAVLQAEEKAAEEARIAKEEKEAAEKKAAAEAEQRKKDAQAKLERDREAAKRAAEKQEPAQSQPEQSQGQIKGSYSGIYHVPGSTYYDRTKNVKEWFNTVQEAEAAGYRAPKR